MIAWLLRGLRPLEPYLCHEWSPSLLLVMHGAWAHKTGVESKASTLLPLLRFRVCHRRAVHEPAVRLERPLGVSCQLLVLDYLHQV